MKTNMGEHLDHIGMIYAKATASNAGPGAPLPAAAVLHIEVVQSIQDNTNAVPLVAGKTTVLRLFLTGTAQKPVTAEIAWQRAGTAESYLGGRNTIELSSQLGTLLEARSRLENSVNFLLPPEATAAGELAFRVTRVTAVGEGAVTLGGKLDGQCQFLESVPLRIRAVGMRYRDPNGDTVAPDAVHFSFLRSYLKRAYPCGEVEWSQIVVDADFTAPFDADTPTNCNAQLAAMRSREVSHGEKEGVDVRTHYYGLVSDAFGHNFMRGLAYDIPGEPRPDIVASGPAGIPVNFNGDTDLSYADWYGAHELGHTFGRFHPGFPPPDQQGGQDASDPTFPYPDGRISGAGEDYLGFDVGDYELDLPMKVLAGETTHDVMTYRENQWVSAYTYAAILARLNAEQLIRAAVPGGQ